MLIIDVEPPPADRPYMSQRALWVLLIHWLFIAVTEEGSNTPQSNPHRPKETVLAVLTHPAPSL